MAKVAELRKQTSSSTAHPESQSDALSGSLKTSETSPAATRAHLMRASSPRTHTLRHGETVYGVAKKEGIEVKELLKINGLTEESARHIPEGKKLQLTAPQKAETTHVMRSGETIYSLAKQRNLDYLSVLLKNGLDEASARNLKEGTEIELGESKEAHNKHAGQEDGAYGKHSQEQPAKKEHTKAHHSYDFSITQKTRDQIDRRSTVGHRLVSLDFNDAKARTARGIEIVIPDDATKQERRAAEAYVKAVQEFFKSHGLDRPIRGVHTRSEAGRGVKGQFHTEPFFMGDTAAVNAIKGDLDGYAKVLAKTLGTLEGVTFMPPHKQNDPGANKGKFNERDFAKSSIIPELQKLSRRE